MHAEYRVQVLCLLIYPSIYVCTTEEAGVVGAEMKGAGRKDTMTAAIDGGRNEFWHLSKWLGERLE